MRTLYPSPRTTAYVSAVVFALVCSSLAVSAAPTNTTTVAKSDGFFVPPPFIEPAIPQSTFQVPKKPADGRDPFFPKSVRGVDQGVNKSSTTNTPVAELVLKGISGTPEQPLAIINNATFSTGEEGDVVSRAGRIRIRCVEINMSAGTVSVQVGGQTRELRLAPSK